VVGVEKTINILWCRFFMNTSKISKETRNRRFRVRRGPFKSMVALGCKLFPSPYLIFDLFLLGLFYLIFLNIV